MKYAACAVLLLVSSALAMPTSHDVTDLLSTTDSLQQAVKTNKPAVGQEPSADKIVESLNLPPSTPAVRYDSSSEAEKPVSETPSTEYAAAEDSKLTDDILGGKKAVVVVEFFNLPNDDDDGVAAARKQCCVDDTTSDQKQESTAGTAVTESPNKFPGKTESSSQNSEDKTASSSEQRQVRSSDSNSQNVHDEGNEEDGMSVAETIIFRPLFSYRQDTAARRRYFREVLGSHTDFDYY